MSKLNLWEYLYNKKLPEVYKTEDAHSLNKFPLKRFFQVLGVGFGYMENVINDLENLYDVDNCPTEFLGYIVDTMGFVFPYALPEKDQRKFIKILPKLYKAKGTPKAFEYLAREIFGTSSGVRAYKETYVPGMTPRQWRRIYVEVSTDGEQFNLGRKQEYFKEFCELVRPVNTILVTVLIGYLQDAYDTDRLEDPYALDKVDDFFQEDSYRFKWKNSSHKMDVDFFVDDKKSILDYKLDDVIDKIQEEYQDFISYIDSELYRLNRAYETEEKLKDTTNENLHSDVLEEYKDSLSITYEETYRHIRIKDVAKLDINFNLDAKESLLDFNESNIDDTIKDYNFDKVKYADAEVVKRAKIEEIDTLRSSFSDKYKCKITDENRDSLKQCFSEDLNLSITEECQTTIKLTRPQAVVDSLVCLDAGFYLDDIYSSKTVMF